MCSTSIPSEKMYEILFFLAKRAFYLENGDIDRSTDNSLQIRKYKARHTEFILELNTSQVCM